MAPLTCGLAWQAKLMGAMPASGTAAAPKAAPAGPEINNLFDAAKCVPDIPPTSVVLWVDTLGTGSCPWKKNRKQLLGFRVQNLPSWELDMRVAPLSQFGPLHPRSELLHT